METWSKRDFAAAGLDVELVQDNHSRSSRGVLRGLHFQDTTAPLGKLVRCTCGEVFDVAVDLRAGSASLGRWFGTILSAENKQQLWVPVGFAHGFLVVSDVAEVLYKTTDYYAPAYERCIVWNDPDLNVRWPTDGSPVVSDKDDNGDLFKDAEVFP